MEIFILVCKKDIIGDLNDMRNEFFWERFYLSFQLLFQGYLIIVFNYL